MSTSRPLVSVILPTFRRPDGLSRALDALAGQGEGGFEWELVVIDNDRSGEAESLLHARRTALGERARVVAEPRRGSAFARNRGIDEAAGEIIAMLDDDVVPAPGWLARLVEPIRAGRADATGGRVVLDPAVARPRWFDETGIGGYLTQLDLGEAERDLDDGEIILTANAAFRAELLRESGGFDPALGPRGRTQLVNDDTLLVRRVRAAGGRVRYVPAATVVHELPATRLRRSYLFRRAYAQGRSDWILDRELLGRRRLGGARVALGWLAQELGRRRTEGFRSPGVAFHAACDVVRTAGSLREAVTLAFRRR